MGKKTRKQLKLARQYLSKKKRKSRKKQPKKFKQLNCSPTSKLDFSCYTPPLLNKLKMEWNSTHKATKIKSNKPRKIWEQLKSELSDKCSTERCWLDQTFMLNKTDRRFNQDTFAPNAPSTWKENPNEWLNSTDINKVMKQYEKAYPKFRFIGPSPIDFNKKKLFGQCVWNDLCNFNLDSYIKNGISKIGIIFNTDPHYLSGSHWICLFINIDKEFIYYFDSNADDTPKEIRKFINTVKSQAKSKGITLKEYTNTTEHQFSNTECGMYVLYIISTLIKTNTLPTIFKKRIPDSAMIELRKVFFN
jgi:hypothetical protein